MQWGSFFLVLFGVVYHVNGFLNEYHGPPLLQNFKPRNTAQWATITQLVDNFNPADNRTYQMRYLANTEFYKPGGPIFILLGGEWTLQRESAESGLPLDMARQHNGILFATEHRFYGHSQPFSDWSTKNLGYLTVDQALADVAYLIQYIRKTLNAPNSKVVIVGGSYAGVISTWMRLKYPHLVDAAWASSAPVVAQLDSPEYYQMVGESIKQYSPQCYQIIQQASAIKESLMQTPEGRLILDKSFNTCRPTRNEFPYNQYFWSQVATIFTNMVQYATPETIVGHCNTIINVNSTNPMEKFATWLSRDYQKGRCIANYDSFLDHLATPVIDIENQLRPWYYQECTKFGWLKTTTTGNQMFGNNHITPNLIRRMCSDLFGPEYGLNIVTQAPERTNIQYGGRNKALTKLISIQGSIDPWKWAGILTDLHEDAPARVVQGTSHCADLHSISPFDNEQMIAAKQFVMSTIARWIQ